MLELPDDLYDTIKELCARGDKFSNAGDYRSAIEAYDEAWTLLPDPKDQWSAATWILAALGDTRFLSGDFGAAEEAFDAAVMHSGGFGNPFIHLRLGQCHFELGNLDRAANGLTRAFGLEGIEIFDDEDPKYFEFLKTRILPPRGGW
jgi:tetratricopeptide (TPR) repeat protein